MHSLPQLTPPPARILIIGGYGFFGRRLTTRLAHQTNLHLIIAGRSLGSAESLVQQLRPVSRATLECVQFDVTAPNLSEQLVALAPTIVVHVAGPFQGQDYRVALACIHARAHYIDLADGREFVEGIVALNAAAEDAGVLVTSGASSVPALSSAVVDSLAEGLCSLESIDVGISPGNRTERGLSTMQGILSYCGKALPSASNVPSFGWSGTRQHHYPSPVGSRLLSPCDVPDLTLFAERYHGKPKITFGAGLELEFLHRGMNLMSWMARHRLVHNWASHAKWLKVLADLFQSWGSDAGAMHVYVKGTTANGSVRLHQWQLLALHGDGPFVPTLAASALIRKIANNTCLTTGAMPCIGLLTLEDFMYETHGLHLTTERKNS